MSFGGSSAMGPVRRLNKDASRFGYDKLAAGAGLGWPAIPASVPVNETASLCRSCEMNDKSASADKTTENEIRHARASRQVWRRRAAAVSASSRTSATKVNTNGLTCPLGALDR